MGADETDSELKTNFCDKVPFKSPPTNNSETWGNSQGRRTSFRRILSQVFIFHKATDRLLAPATDPLV